MEELPSTEPTSNSLPATTRIRPGIIFFFFRPGDPLLAVLPPDGNGQRVYDGSDDDNYHHGQPHSGSPPEFDLFSAGLRQRRQPGRHDPQPPPNVRDAARQGDSAAAQPGRNQTANPGRQTQTQQHCRSLSIWRFRQSRTTTRRHRHGYPSCCRRCRPN